MSKWLKALAIAGAGVGGLFTGGATLGLIPAIAGAGGSKDKTPTDTLHNAPPELLDLLKQLMAQQQAGQPLRNSAMQGAFGLLPQWARNTSMTPQAPGQPTTPTGAVPRTGAARRATNASPDYDAQMRDWLARVQG